MPVKNAGYFTDPGFCVLYSGPMKSTQTKSQMHGNLFIRKRRGRKLQFVMGGSLDVEAIQAAMQWDWIHYHNYVVEFHGEENGEPCHCSILPPTQERN